MHKQVIHIRRDRIPKFKSPTEPDSPVHRAIRIAILSLSLIAYAAFIISWTLGLAFTRLNFMQVSLSIFFLLFVPLVTGYFIRPGKRPLILCTLAALVFSRFFPVLFFIIPLILLAAAMIKSIRTAHTNNHSLRNASPPVSLGGLRKPFTSREDMLKDFWDRK